MNSDYFKIQDCEWDNRYVLEQNSITILPYVLDGKKIVYHQSSHNFIKLAKKNSLQCKLAIDGCNEYIEQHSIDVFLPSIAFLFNFYRENQEIIDLIIGTIKDCVLTKMSKSDKNANVHFQIELVDENQKTSKKISYEGPIDGVDELKKIIKELKID